MAEWTFFDFAELTGRNKIKEWIEELCEPDQARIDARLIAMVTRAAWPPKWVSSYACREELYEFRIKGTVQYRPLGTYFGQRRYILLAGAIEKGDRIPARDVTAAETRKKLAEGNKQHAVAHIFQDSEDLEKDANQGIP